MKEALDAAMIHKAEIRLNQITKYFAVNYPNLGGTNKERDSEISSYEKDLYLEVLGPLSDPDGSGSVSARFACLPAYMLAACVHMAILQERANLMPKAVGRYLSWLDLLI